MNHKKNYSIKHNVKQSSEHLKKKNAYKGSGYEFTPNKKLSKFLNKQLNYNNYNNSEDSISAKTSGSEKSPNEHPFINTNNKTGNLCGNKRQPQVSGKKGKEENLHESYEEEEEEEKENQDKEEEEEEDEMQGEKQHVGVGEEEYENEVEEDNVSFEVSDFSENRKKKERMKFKNIIYRNNFQNRKYKGKMKKCNTDYYDIYSNIYGYYDIFTEDKNEKKKYKYFNDVFWNVDRKYENDDFVYDEKEVNTKVGERCDTSATLNNRGNVNKKWNKKASDENTHFKNKYVNEEYNFSSSEGNRKKRTSKHFINSSDYVNKRNSKKKKKRKNSSDFNMYEDERGSYQNIKKKGVDIPRGVNMEFNRNKAYNGDDNDVFKKNNVCNSDNENSELESYLYDKYSEIKGNKKKGRKNEMNELSDSELSLDSSCSISPDFFNDAKKLKTFENKETFLKRPTRKRMNKLKKILEIFEYALYSEEKEGIKIESRLYKYVVLAKSLKEKIFTLEEINNSNKNIMNSYEKDICRLKEQNEEMKKTLSTFENELSNLINKFDKNFAKELIDTKSQNDILKKEVERLKMEIEKKNCEIKKIENMNECAKGDNINGVPSKGESGGNLKISSNNSGMSKGVNTEGAVTKETNSQENTKVEPPTGTSNVTSNTTASTTASTAVNVEKLPEKEHIIEFSYYYGNSDEIDENVVNEFLAKLKTMKVTSEKNTERYDDETKVLLYGFHISNFILEQKEICNHKRVLKQLQEMCILESKVLHLHICLKKDKSEKGIKKLQKCVIRQLENSELEKEKPSIVNAVILCLIFKNMNIFNLYKIFITSLKYDNFRWVHLIKKALFLKFFDLGLVEVNTSISEMIKPVEEQKSNRNMLDENIQLKHPLFYCSNEALKHFLLSMYFNISNTLLNPETKDNLYHYVLQKKNLDVLKILKLTGKNSDFIFQKNAQNKTPLDYIDNEDIKIDLISGYILDMAGKGAEHYKNGNFTVAYDFYTEALERQVNLSETFNIGKAMHENIGKLYYNRARTLMHLNRWMDVIENCNNCLKYIPKYVNAFDTQIQAYEHLLEYENALAVYKTMCVKCNIKPDEKEEKLKSQINATSFQILKLNKNCTVAEIKQAFSNLSKKWHPDKLGINTSADMKKRHNNHFKKLFKAKQLLLNDAERMKEKKKKETNFIYPIIIDDTNGTTPNTSNKRHEKEAKKKMEEDINASKEMNQTAKNNRDEKYGTTYSTNGDRSANGTSGMAKGNETDWKGEEQKFSFNFENLDKVFKNNSKNVENSKNLYNAYRDDMDNIQEKIKNYNRINGDVENKFLSQFSNMFDNKTNVNNEKVDESFYKKLKEEYEVLNDEELTNLKTKLSNSINNLIKTEVSLKNEYHELCNKEKTNVIMNARLCILQEIQKTLCIRLDKERKLKVIENILKGRTGGTKTPNKTESVARNKTEEPNNANVNTSNVDSKNKQTDEAKKNETGTSANAKDSMRNEFHRENDNNNNNNNRVRHDDDNDEIDDRNYEKNDDDIDDGKEKTNAADRETDQHLEQQQEQKQKQERIFIDKSDEEQTAKREKGNVPIDEGKKKKKLKIGKKKYKDKLDEEIEDALNRNRVEEDFINVNSETEKEKFEPREQQEKEYLKERGISVEAAKEEIEKKEEQEVKEERENKKRENAFENMRKGDSFLADIAKQLNQSFKYMNLGFRNISNNNNGSTNDDYDNNNINNDNNNDNKNENIDMKGKLDVASNRKAQEHAQQKENEDKVNGENYAEEKDTEENTNDNISEESVIFPDQNFINASKNEGLRKPKNMFFNLINESSLFVKREPEMEKKQNEETNEDKMDEKREDPMNAFFLNSFNQKGTRFKMEAADVSDPVSEASGKEGFILGNFANKENTDMNNLMKIRSIHEDTYFKKMHQWEEVGEETHNDDDDMEKTENYQESNIRKNDILKSASRTHASDEREEEIHSKNDQTDFMNHLKFFKNEKNYNRVTTPSEGADRDFFHTTSFIKGNSNNMYFFDNKKQSFQMEEEEEEEEEEDPSHRIDAETFPMHGDEQPFYTKEETQEEDSYGDGKERDIQKNLNDKTRNLQNKDMTYPVRDNSESNSSTSSIYERNFFVNSYADKGFLYTTNNLNLNKYNTLHLGAPNLSSNKFNSHNLGEKFGEDGYASKNYNRNSTRTDQFSYGGIDNKNGKGNHLGFNERDINQESYVKLYENSTSKNMQQDSTFFDPAFTPIVTNMRNGVQQNMMNTDEDANSSKNGVTPFANYEASVEYDDQNVENSVANKSRNFDTYQISRDGDEEKKEEEGEEEEEEDEPEEDVIFVNQRNTNTDHYVDTTFKNDNRDQQNNGNEFVNVEEALGSNLYSQKGMGAEAKVKTEGDRSVNDKRNSNLEQFMYDHTYMYNNSTPSNKLRNVSQSYNFENIRYHNSVMFPSEYESVDKKGVNKMFSDNLYLSPDKNVRDFKSVSSTENLEKPKFKNEKSKIKKENGKEHVKMKKALFEKGNRKGESEKSKTNSKENSVTTKTSKKMVHGGTHKKEDHNRKSKNKLKEKK